MACLPLIASSQARPSPPRQASLPAPDPPPAAVGAGASTEQLQQPQHAASTQSPLPQGALPPMHPPARGPLRQPPPLPLQAPAPAQLQQQQLAHVAASAGLAQLQAQTAAQARESREWLQHLDRLSARARGMYHQGPHDALSGVAYERQPAVLPPTTDPHTALGALLDAAMSLAGRGDRGKWQGGPPS